MFTQSNGDRIGDPNYAIVITDGRSNVNQGRTIPSANEARRRGITMLAVGIGENGKVDRAELNGIADDPDIQHAFLLEFENQIPQIADKILERLCQ